MSCTTEGSNHQSNESTVMNLNALAYRLPPGSEPVRQAITIDATRASDPISGVGLPVLLVVRPQDIAAHGDCCEIQIQNAKALADILLPRKGYLKAGRFFVLRGKYKTQGTLNNAIKKFLERAEKSGQRKAYIITVQKGLYEKLPNALSEPGRPGPELPFTEAAYGGHQPDLNNLPLAEKLALDWIGLKESDDKLIDDRIPAEYFKGASYTCQLVRYLIMRAAKNDEAVFIEGERGTGKELVAEAIHNLSDRKEKPFIRVNMSAIPHDLLELELFGGKKNFPNPGTPETKGAFQEAGGGTLFLDEIGDMAPFHLPKVLRALSKNEKTNMYHIQPVGYTRTIPVDVRIIAATNQNVRARDKYGKHIFRQDVYDRVATLIIRTPRLNSHPQDIPMYANNYWRKLVENSRATLPPDLIDLLMKQNWEDNVRGLENVLRDLNILFESNPTAAKLALVLRYRNFTEDRDITPENLVSAELTDMIEILAKASHATWYKKREKEGWVWGPSRVETKDRKTNPDMKPYAELSEAQKDYARDEARAILRAILGEGYAIVR